MATMRLTDSSNEQMELISTNVSRAGLSIKVYLLKLGSEDGLITRQAAELFGVSESTILKHIDRHNITTSMIARSNLQLLKNNGIVRNRAISAVFIPRDGLRELMRVVNTDEAKAAYRELFDDAEELMRIKPRYLAQEEIIAGLRGDLEKALDLSEATQIHNELLCVELTDSKAQVEHLSARLEAADHHIALGGNKKAPKFSIPIYRREPNDIFNNPVYSIEIVKKTRDEMNPDEQHRFQTYHSTRTIVGLSRGLEKTFDKLGVTNDEARSMLTTVKESALALKEQLEPNAQGLFVLNRLEPQIYLN